MVLNYIWVAFFVIAFIVALIKLLFMGNTEIFTELVNSTFTSSKTAFEISLGLTGILSLWLGIMKIGEQSGMINALSRWLSPVFCRLFPEIPKGHPAMGSINLIKFISMFPDLFHGLELSVSCRETSSFIA